MSINEEVQRPGYRKYYNINSELRAVNTTDEDGNPYGGHVRLDLDANDDTKPDFPALYVRWQEGPRGQKGSDELKAPNGAFIEDVLWAALERLEFFQDSKYRDRGNAIAITHIEGALQALKDRQLARSYRGVEGKNEV